MNNEFPSIYLLAPLFGWLAAHLVKYILIFVASGGKDRGLDIFFRAGGMPSSHSAVMVATLTVIGALQGIGSPIFALGTALTLIVLYDAINVRRSVGEQGDILREVIKQAKIDAKFFTAYGHTLTEVVVGSTVGLVVGSALLQIL